MRLVFVPVLWSDQLGQCWSWRNISVTLVTLKVIQEQGQKIHLFAGGCQPYVAFFILKAQEFGHLITCALISAVYPNFKRKILFCFVRALAQKIFFFSLRRFVCRLGRRRVKKAVQYVGHRISYSCSSFLFFSWAVVLAVIFFVHWHVPVHCWLGRGRAAVTSCKLTCGSVRDGVYK